MFNSDGKLWGMSYDGKEDSTPITSVPEEKKLFTYISKVNPYPSLMLELLTACYSAASHQASCLGDGVASPTSTDDICNSLLVRCRDVIKCYRTYETISGGIQGLIDTCGDVWFSIENSMQLESGAASVSNEKKSMGSPVTSDGTVSNSNGPSATKQVPTESLATQDIGLTLLSTLLYTLVEENFISQGNKGENPHPDMKVAEEAFQFVSSSKIPSSVYFNSTPFGQQLKSALSECAMVTCCSFCTKLGSLDHDNESLLDTARSVIKSFKLVLSETSQNISSTSALHPSDCSHDNTMMSKFVTHKLPILRKSCLQLVIGNYSKCDASSVEETKMTLRSVILNQWVPGLYKRLYPRNPPVTSTAPLPPAFSQPVMYAPLLAGIVQLVEIGDILASTREEITTNLSNEECDNEPSWNFTSRTRRAIFHHMLSKSDVYNKAEISALSEDKNDKKRLTFVLSRGLAQTTTTHNSGSDKGNVSTSKGKPQSTSNIFVDTVRKGLESINIIVNKQLPPYSRIEEDQFKTAFQDCCPSTLFETDKSKPHITNPPEAGVVAAAKKAVAPSVSKTSNAPCTAGDSQVPMLCPLELVYTLLVTNPIEAWICLFDAAAMGPISPSVKYDGDANIAYETLVSDGEFSARFHELYATLPGRKNGSSLDNKTSGVSLIEMKHYRTSVMRSFTHRLVFYLNAIERLVHHVFQSSATVLSMNPFTRSSNTDTDAGSTDNIISKYIMLYLVSCMDAAIVLLGKYRVSGPYVLMCLGMEANVSHMLRDHTFDTTGDIPPHAKGSTKQRHYAPCSLASMWESPKGFLEINKQPVISLSQKVDTNDITMNPPSVWGDIFDWIKKAILNRNEFGYCLVFIPLFKAMCCGAGGCGSHLSSICYPCVSPSSAEVPGGYDSCQHKLISLLSIPEHSKLMTTVRQLVEGPFPYFLSFNGLSLDTSNGEEHNCTINALPRESVQFIEHYELLSIISVCAAEAAVFVSGYKTKNLTSSDRQYYSPGIVDATATFFYSFMSLLRMKNNQDSTEGATLFSKSGILGKLECFRQLENAVEGLLKGNSIQYMETPSSTRTAAGRPPTTLSDTFMFWPLLAAVEKELLEQLEQERASFPIKSEEGDDTEVLTSMISHTSSLFIARNLTRYLSILGAPRMPTSGKSQDGVPQHPRLPFCSNNTCATIMSLGACDVVPIQPFDHFKSITSFLGESFPLTVMPTEITSYCEPLWNSLQERQNAKVDDLLRTSGSNSDVSVPTLDSLCIDVLSHIAHLPCPTSLPSGITSILQMLEEHDYRFKALVAFFKMLLFKASISVSDAEAAAHVIKALVSVKEIPLKKVYNQSSLPTSRLGTIPKKEEVHCVKLECDNVDNAHLASVTKSDEEERSSDPISPVTLTEKDEKEAVTSEKEDVEIKKEDNDSEKINPTSTKTTEPVKENNQQQKNESVKNSQSSETLLSLLPLSYVILKAISQVLIDGCHTYVTQATKQEAASLCHFTKVLSEEVIIPWCTHPTVQDATTNNNTGSRVNVRMSILPDSKFPMLPMHGSDTSDVIMSNIIVESAKLYESCLCSSSPPSCSLWVSFSLKSSLRNVMGWTYRQRKHCKWAEDHPSQKSQAEFIAHAKGINFTSVSEVLGVSGTSKDSVDKLSELWPNHNSQLERAEDLIIHQIRTKCVSRGDNGKGRSPVRRTPDTSSNSYGNAPHTSGTERHANRPAVVPRNTNSSSSGYTSYPSAPVGSRRERSRSPSDRNRVEKYDRQKQQGRAISDSESRGPMSKSTAVPSRADVGKRRTEQDYKKTVESYPTTQPPSYQKSTFGNNRSNTSQSSQNGKFGYNNNNNNNNNPKRHDMNVTDEMLKKRAARFT